MADNKTDLSINSANGKKQTVKDSWTIRRIATTIIIAILAFLMIGGTFYYIFTPGFRKSANAFGFYDGNPIIYEYGNVFGKTLQSDPLYVDAYNNNDFNQMYQSWYAAYQSQVVFDAVDKKASDAGVIAPTEIVNKALLDSGVYNNEDGVFDEEKYKNTPVAERQAMFQYVKSVCPYQTVLNDYSYALIPDAEKAFVSKLNADLRDFEYFNVNFAAYPDDLALEYANANPHIFDKMDLSIITCSTEEDANKAYQALNDGKSWKEVVEEFSEDNYKENEGAFGTALYANVVATNVENTDDMTKIWALNPDQYTEPIKGPYAYAIYKLNKPVEPADFTDADTLYYVKSVINDDDKVDVKPYVEEAVAVASAEYEADFDGTAEKYGLKIISVNGVNNNVSSSMFMLDAAYSDGMGFLAGKLAEDEDLSVKLFKANKGDVFGPIETETGTLFVRVANTESASDMAESMDSYYDSFSTQFVLADIRDYVFASPKHENKFSEKFFEIFLKNMIGTDSGESGESETATVEAAES